MVENILIFYKLIEAQKNRDLINGFLLAENYKDKLYRYIVYKSKTDFEEAILKSGRLFEIIESDECRAYFDIDYKDTENIDFEEDLNCITNFLDKVFDISCNPLVFVRDDETVKSAHIYYDFFTNKKTLKKITNVLKNKIECIDTSIYSKNRNFCLPNHTKFEYNSARRFVEYTFWETLERIKYNVSDFLCDIRHNAIEKIRIPKLTFGEIDVNVDLNSETNLNSENNNESLGDGVDFNLDNLINFLPKKFYFHKFHFKLLVKYIIDNYTHLIRPFLKYSKGVIKKDYTPDEVETYISNIQREKLTTHGIVNLIRKYYNIQFFDYKLLEDFITFACDVMKTPESEYEEVRCKIKKSNLTLSPKKEIVIANYIIKLDKFLILNPSCNTFYYFNTFVKNGDRQSQNVNVKNVYIDDIINNENILSERLIAVKALYGSGKTKRIVFHILEKLFKMKSKCKVCFLTETNSLNTSITQKLKNYMCNLFPRILIGSHQDTKMKNEKNEYDIFVCSLESIHMCNEIYDYLILDEYESLLFHFTSKTMSQMTDECMKFDKLVDLMKSSKRCILLDADLTMSRVNIAKSIIGCDCSFYNCLDNNFKDYTYSVFYKRSEMFNKFKISCDNSKKIIFCSNSKKELERIYEERKCNFNGNTALLCSNKVVRIHYGNSKEEKVIPKIDFIADLDNNLQMLDVDILLFTPTITTGVSIEVNFFDVMYASGFNKNTAIARAFVQMLFRPRNLKDKDINICFIQPTSFNKCFFDITDFEKNIEYQSCLYDIKLKILNGDETVCRKEIYDMMYNLNVIEKEMSQFYFTQYVCSLLMSHNLNVNYVFKDEQKEYDTAMYKYILDQKCVEDIRSADLITETDKEIIEENNKMSGFDKLDWDKIQRYNLTNFHPNVIIRDSIITNWNGNNDNIKCLIELKERINSSKNKLFYENYDKIDYNEIDCLTQFNERLIEREISDYIYNLLKLTRSNNYELKIKTEDFDKIISNLTEEDISKLNKYHQVLINDKTNASPFKVKLEKNNLNHLKDILNKLNIQMTNHIIIYEYKNDPRDLLKPEMLRLRTYNTDKKEKNKIYRKESIYYYLAVKNNLYFKINESNDNVVRTFHSNYNKITKKNDIIYKITELEKSYKVDILSQLSELNCDGYKMETFKKSKDFYTAKHPLQNNGEKYYPKVYKQQTLNRCKVATFVKTSEILHITKIPDIPEVYKKKRYLIKPIGVYERSGEIVYHTTNKIEQKNETNCRDLKENENVNETDLKTNLHNELTNPDTLMRAFKYDLTLKNDISKSIIETEKIVYVPEESVDYHDE
jgi:hypothetical protein